MSKLVHKERTDFVLICFLHFLISLWCLKMALQVLALLNRQLSLIRTSEPVHTTETFVGLRGRLPLVSGKELHGRVARKCIPACAFHGWRRRSFRGRSSQGLPWVCGSFGAVTSGLRVSWALSLLQLPRRVETRLLWVSDRYMCCHVARSLSSWRIRPACST